MTNRIIYEGNDYIPTTILIGDAQIEPMFRLGHVILGGLKRSLELLKFIESKQGKIVSLDILGYEHSVNQFINEHKNEIIEFFNERKEKLITFMEIAENAILHALPDLQEMSMHKKILETMLNDIKTRTATLIKRESDINQNASTAAQNSNKYSKNNFH